MSLTTITQAALDPALHARINASVWKEAISNPEFGDTAFGRQVQGGGAPILMVFSYPIAVDNEAVYEAALLAGHQNPGADPSIITDAAISTAVQVHWPLDLG